MMKFVVFLLCILFVLSNASRISRFAQEETRSNQYLIVDDDDTNLLVDTGSGSMEDNQSLLDFIDSQNVNTLRAVFITQGDSDAYGGIPTVSEAFPEARIEVPNAGVYFDIVNSAPEGDFDWPSSLFIALDDDAYDELDLLVLPSDIPAQVDHYGYLRNFDENWVVTGDALYIDVHPYLGAGVDIDSLRSWYGTVLPALSSGGSLGFNENSRYFPGRGPPGDYLQVEAFIGYLQQFETLLLSCPNGENPRRLESIRQTLIELYPRYELPEILDAMLTNPAWLQAQADFNPCALVESSEGNRETISMSIIFIGVVASMLSMILF